MRQRLIAMFAAPAMVLGLVTGSVVMASPAQAAACTKITHQAKTDPDGHSWTSSWSCGNNAGVKLYREPNRGSISGYQNSSNSLFVCWKRGALHSGNNNVWYYTQGDEVASGAESRRAWGYMPAVDVHTPDGSDPWSGMAQCPYPATPAKPARSNGSNKTVLFLHGYDYWASVVCSDYWGNGHAASLFRSMGWDAPGQVVNLTYYSGGGSACLRFSNSSHNTAIENIGLDFAWYVYNNYSSKGKAVEVVTHSMGGLIARVAIAGTTHDRTVRGMPFPPYLYIEDVAALSTPHQGIRDNIKSLCQNVSTNQCTQMYPGSDFYRLWIDRAGYENPPSDMLTDWSVFGAGDDWTVSSGSALNVGAVTHFGHKYLFQSGSGIDHEKIHMIGTNGGKTYTVPFCDAGSGCNMANWASWSRLNSSQGPLWIAAQAVSEQSW